MRVISARNVNGALSEALWWLKIAGMYSGSRNGSVLRAPEPVTTVYARPAERVMFSALRDANPFFHLMESIWMLGGKNDVAFPARYARQINAYSDDGLTLAGGYGHRWRNRFGVDQLTAIIKLLRTDPSTRRAVLQMWDCATDLDAAASGGLDVPCNLICMFDVVSGMLNMTVCCRSNDAVWGAYGANAVHFSMLQQFLAEATGISIGKYYQVSNNLHIYTGRPDVQRLLADNTREVIYKADDRYAAGLVRPVALIQPHEYYENFLNDVEMFLTDPDGDSAYSTSFFNDTVVPAQIAHTAHKNGDKEDALQAAISISAADWRAACVEWLRRRYEG